MILIVMGVSGSGKTTLARALAKATGWQFAEGDDYHSRVLAFCKSCQRHADADLAAIVDAGRGRGDVPLRCRCSQCSTDRTDFVVTSRDVVKPW
jgi:cytidylate kinase